MIEQWISVHEEMIQEIQNTTEKLKVHDRNVNISRITGSATSILGSAMAITGFALAPFMLDASIGLSVGGIALVDTVIEKSSVSRAQEQLARDYDGLNLISAIAKEIEKKIDDVRQKCTDISTVKVLGEGILRTSTTGARLGTAAINTLKIGTVVLRVGSTIAKGVAMARIALNVV